MFTLFYLFTVYMLEKENTVNFGFDLELHFIICFTSIALKAAHKHMAWCRLLATICIMVHHYMAYFECSDLPWWFTCAKNSKREIKDFHVHNVIFGKKVPYNKTWWYSICQVRCHRSPFHSDSTLFRSLWRNSGLIVTWYVELKILVLTSNVPFLRKYQL